MKNHTLTFDCFELRQVPIGFRCMTTPQVSSLSFRGCVGAGWQSGRGDGCSTVEGSDIDTKGRAHESSVNKTPILGRCQVITRTV